MTDAEDVTSASLSYRHRGGMIKQKATVDQGHLELGTYSNEWVDFINFETHTHIHSLQSPTAQAYTFAADIFFSTFASLLAPKTQKGMVFGKMHKNKECVCGICISATKMTHTCTVDTHTHTTLSMFFLHNQTHSVSPNKWNMLPKNTPLTQDTCPRA